MSWIQNEKVGRPSLVLPDNTEGLWSTCQDFYNDRLQSEIQNRQQQERSNDRIISTARVAGPYVMPGKQRSPARRWQKSVVRSLFGKDTEKYHGSTRLQQDAKRPFQPLSIEALLQNSQQSPVPTTLMQLQNSQQNSELTSMIQLQKSQQHPEPRTMMQLQHSQQRCVPTAVMQLQNSQQSPELPTMMQPQNSQQSPDLPTMTQLENSLQSPDLPTLMQMPNNQQSPELPTMMHLPNSQQSPESTTMMQLQNSQQYPEPRTMMQLLNNHQHPVPTTMMRDHGGIHVPVIQHITADQLGFEVDSTFQGSSFTSAAPVAARMMLMPEVCEPSVSDIKEITSMDMESKDMKSPVAADPIMWTKSKSHKKLRAKLSLIMEYQTRMNKPVFFLDDKLKHLKPYVIMGWTSDNYLLALMQKTNLIVEMFDNALDSVGEIRKDVAEKCVKENPVVYTRELVYRVFTLGELENTGMKLQRMSRNKMGAVRRCVSTSFPCLTQTMWVHNCLWKLKCHMTFILSRRVKKVQKFWIEESQRSPMS